MRLHGAYCQTFSGVEASDLTVNGLMNRVDDRKNNSRNIQVNEIILGLNPNLEGDSTSLYLASELLKLNISVTRLARGLPSGSQIEYANTQVLADAIAGRQGM